jgi:hypothetical protein
MADGAAADVADGLAEHVAAGPKMLASDGGIVGGDGAELVDDGDAGDERPADVDGLCD